MCGRPRLRDQQFVPVTEASIQEGVFLYEAAYHQRVKCSTLHRFEALTLTLLASAPWFSRALIMSKSPRLQAIHKAVQPCSSSYLVDCLLTAVTADGCMPMMA